MLDLAIHILQASWLVLGQMAPYLLLGFVVAGILSVVFSPEWIELHLGRRGFGPVLKASLLGIPLPLCSCGVIPVAASIRRHGASRGATLSFLLSTPQTGVDSITVTWALLGPILAVYRPIAALVTGLLGGGLVQGFGEKERSPATASAGHDGCGEACCADRGKRNVLWRAVHYGLLILPRDIGGALLIGVLAAGAMTVVFQAQQWESYLGGGVLSMILVMAIGIPIYVCATASVPIALGLIYLGASPGAAFAFLVAGPATNAATISTVWKVLGRRSAMIFLLTIVISAVAGGLVLDHWIPGVAASLPKDLHKSDHLHGEGHGWISSLWAIALLAVLAIAYFRTSKPTAKDLGLPDGETPDEPQTAVPGERIELDITGMHCSYCTVVVTRVLKKCSGVQHVEVTLHPGRAVVAGADLDAGNLIAAVKTLGYEAAVLTKAV